MKKIKQISVVAAILLAWQIAAQTGLWSEFVLPSPGSVFAAFLIMLESGELLGHVLVSAKRVFIGFAIASFIATALGTLAGLRPRATGYYEHILEFLRHVPPLSLIPLLIIWFGIGETSRIIIIVLTMFFPVYMNVKKGFLSCDAKLVEVGKSLGFTGFQNFYRIVVPQALPNILVGMRIGMGYAWRAIIGAEMIAAASGLGFFVWQARQMARSSAVIVGIITIGIIGILFDKLFSLALKKAIRGGIDDSWR
ncbi:MAG: ABC transporter permease [Spirochaetes bacterium]|nr:ABC transporter permease [Spirochaetota bacterium]